MHKLRIPAILSALALLVVATAAQVFPTPIYSDETAPAVRATTVAPFRLVVASTGNQARYRVREQLVGRDLPNDAVGETSEVSGAIVIGADGQVVAGESRIVVGVANLTSDSDRRDGYVRRRLLEAEQYPTVEIVPTAIHGLPATLPASGTLTLHVTGNLTVRGVTRPTTWNVTAQVQGNRLTGTAATEFTFDEFNLTQPRVPVLLSVDDTIKLEYDFTLDVESATGS